MMIDDLEIKPSATAGITADFTADRTTARVGEAITFSDQSIGGPTSWAWKFPGATPATSSQQNPASIRYSLPGQYAVTLTVSNGTVADSVTKEAFITITSYPSSATLDFEAYPNFILALPPWTLTDVKGGKTYGIEGVYFPNNYSPMAYICFNPSQTTPALTNMIPHGGQKLGCCFSSSPPNNPNDKWIISPRLSLGINPMLEFWVKTYNNNWGDEKFNAAVSTTDSLPGSFTLLNTQPESAPMAWTRKSYHLGAYANQDVYVGIQCVTSDGFIFMIDDISITSTLGIGSPVGPREMTLTPNPASDRVTIRLAKPSTGELIMELISFRGEGIMTELLPSGTSTTSLDVHGMDAGIYLVRLSDGAHVTVGKLIIHK
jgi:PKD repeat protein